MVEILSVVEYYYIENVLITISKINDQTNWVNVMIGTVGGITRTSKSILCIRVYLSL